MADDEQKRLDLELELNRYRNLLRGYPEGSATAQMLRDYIADLEQRLRHLDDD